MASERGIRRRVSAVVTGFALRHLGRKRPYKGEVEDAVRRDWKASMRRLGLRRHGAWHDRFRRRWLRLYRGE